jgi:hypothetical protein
MSNSTTTSNSVHTLRSSSSTLSKATSHGRVSGCIIPSDCPIPNPPFLKTKIVIHKLMVIAALDLLPLLAWHHATMKFFEEYGIPEKLKDEMGQIQLSGLKTGLWIVMWILVGRASHASRKMTWLREMSMSKTDWRNRLRWIFSLPFGVWHGITSSFIQNLGQRVMTA